MPMTTPILWIIGFVWVFFGLWLYMFSRWKDNVLCKAFTTLGPVLLALYALVQQPSTPAWVLFVSVVLFLVADILINSTLLPGVLVFLLGHIGLIVRCFLLGSTWLSLLVPAVLGCALMAFVYRRQLKAMGPLSIALLVYVAVLFGMVSSILSLVQVQGLSLQTASAALGALLFLASDLLLGDIIVTQRKSRTKDCWVMYLYEIAVLLLVLSVFPV